MGKVFMSTLTFDGAATAARPTIERSKADALRIAALALLSIRFIQAFIYWGGGSRRFIYAPAKLDPSAASWMANEFQSAMPGALLGSDHIIAFLLHHFYLLYTSLILFSAAELITGLFLMSGFLTRAAALVSIGLSAVLMLMFGWQGATPPLWWHTAYGLAFAMFSAAMMFAMLAVFLRFARYWTKSEAFRAAHSRAGENKPLYLDHPQFEGFEVRQTVRRGKAAWHLLAEQCARTLTMSVVRGNPEVIYSVRVFRILTHSRLSAR